MPSAKVHAGVRLGQCTILVMGWLLLAATGAVAQGDVCSQLAGLPNEPSLRQEFLRSRLEVRSSSWTEGTTALPASVDPASFKYWSAFRGSEPLSEERFFHICGLEAEEDAAHRRHAAVQRRIHVGNALWKVSIVPMFASMLAWNLTNEEDERPEWILPTLIGSAATSAIGLGLGAWGSGSASQCNASYSTAAAAADGYNEGLCERLSSRSR